MFLISGTVWADDFTVERAVNIDQLDSWADISKFQWQVIDHGIQDNRDEMDALKTLFCDPAPKDTVGFYKQIYKARDNQYIVLRLDKAQGNRPFYVRVTSIQNTEDPSQNSSRLYAAENYVYIMPPIGETQLEVKIALARNIIGFVRYKEDGGENQSSGQWVKGDTLFDMDRIISVGNICLSMFLGIAMISLKLWELHTLALPLIVILVSQVLMMALFVYWVAFPLLGRDYDAAVLADLINTAVITLFLNLL